MFTIQVINKKTGKPMYYKKVSVGFEGMLRGFSKTQYTNRDGEAHFTESNGQGTIYIQGKAEYKGRIEGRKIIYV